MRRLLSFVIPVCLALGLGLGTAAANDSNDGGNNSGGNGGRSAAEEWIAEHVVLRHPPNRVENIVRLILARLSKSGSAQGTGGGSSGNSQVLIEAKIVSVTFKDINKLDLSDIPLFGGLVGPEFNADDITEENRVGNAFSTENGGLFVALEEKAFGGPFSTSISRILVFNDDYSQEIKPLRLDIVPSVTDDGSIKLNIGPLAELQSVQTALPQLDLAEITTDVAVPSGGTILLGGLTQEEVERDENQVPFFNDLPTLNFLFRGTAHQTDSNELLILVSPSVIEEK